MNFIQNNPFRILGVPIDGSVRDFQKQITKSKRFAEVGKLISFETDFPFLGEFKRDSNSITAASNNIEQPLDKLLYSLFWFWQVNHVDEIAIENLKSSKIDKAIEILEKVVKEGNVSEKNYSSLLNLKTLLIGLSARNGALNKKQLIQGIELGGKFLNHSSFQSYCNKIVGDKITISSKEIEKNFISAVYSLVKPYLDKSNGISISEFLQAFKTFSDSSQFNISEKFTADQINRIEQEIEITSNLRTKNDKKTEDIIIFDSGNLLYKNTENDLKFILKVLGKSNVKYQTIANKLASEILQCGIDYFNKIHESCNETLMKKALKLAEYAKLIVCSGQAKSRVDENYQIIKQRINDAPDSIKYKEVLGEMEELTKSINNAAEKLEKNNAINSILFLSDAWTLISSSKPKLSKIKNALGSDDKIYLKLCNDVAIISLNLIILYHNAVITFQDYDNKTRESTIDALKAIDYLPMEQETRKRYKENFSVIYGGGGGGGCYIATMVYGDYDHPQVMILRDFRDNFLSKYFIGRSFIKFYYKYSPKWVEKMKNKKNINLFIRIVLNKIISIFKN